MTLSEITGMQRFAEFSTIIYIRAWFQAPLAASAPSNDLSLLKQLVHYEDLGDCNAAVTAFSRHQWYLSEILVSLAFFNSYISVMVKKAMIQALVEKEGSKQALKRIIVVAASKEFANKTVADYIISGNHL